MADIADAEILGHAHDAPLLADAADLGHVWLDDVEGAVLQPGQEALASCQDLAAGDRHGTDPPEMAIILKRIGLQGFLEPADVIILQHLGRAHRPFQAMRPPGVARAASTKSCEPAPMPSRAARTIASSSLASMALRTDPSRS